MIIMAWHSGVNTGIAGPVLAGMATLAIGFGGFGAWAAMAPLEGAIIAQAKVAVTGSNKVVQHLEGGLVKEILVEEGQRVAAGEAVLVLDGTASRSQHNRLKIQLATLEAIGARALAERNGLEKLEFPAAVAADQAEQVITLLQDQEAEFEAGLQKHHAGLGILDQQIAALEELIAGHEIQKRETELQIDLLAEEREAFEALLAKGLTRKSQVLALKRSEADLKGREGQLVAAIAQARQSIAEIRERIEQTESARIEEASARLSEVRSKRSEVIEQLNAAEDVSERIVVRAPAAGTVIGLTKYNSGAVIAPGQELMTIVPEGTALVVEAQVRPQDIDEVRVGQAARLTFSAFDPRETLPVAGKVVYVSADRLEDERTGEAYYLARLEISTESAPGLDPARIGPGLAAEVFITTGDRTFLDYLTAPLTRTLSRSFRES
jgi:HlyD family secretion protein